MTREQYTIALRLVGTMKCLIEDSHTSMPALDITVAGMRLYLRDRHVGKACNFTALILVGDTHILEKYDTLCERAYARTYHPHAVTALTMLSALIVERVQDTE